MKMTLEQIDELYDLSKLLLRRLFIYVDDNGITIQLPFGGDIIIWKDSSIYEFVLEQMKHSLKRNNQ